MQGQVLAIAVAAIVFGTTVAFACCFWVTFARFVTLKWACAVVFPLAVHRRHPEELYCRQVQHTASFRVPTVLGHHSARRTKACWQSTGMPLVWSNIRAAVPAPEESVSQNGANEEPLSDRCCQLCSHGFFYVRIFQFCVGSCKIAIMLKPRRITCQHEPSCFEGLHRL
jgi:hypothetical protein